MQAKIARLTVKALAPAKYALFAFCDQSANGKLDDDAFGIPKEPFGSSKGQSGDFEEAAITVKSGSKGSLRIVLARH